MPASVGGQANYAEFELSPPATRTVPNGQQGALFPDVPVTLRDLEAELPDTRDIVYPA
jgi:hypothetical protein